VTAAAILELFSESGFDLFADPWNENPFYHGRMKNVMTNIDQLFGSKRFRFVSNVQILNEAAKAVLTGPINPSTFNQQTFVEKSNDIIAIRRDVAVRMKEHWGIN
jgi:hypothetical protein